MRWFQLPLLLLLCSCVHDRWDSYDESSYDVVMEPTVEEFDEHIELLEAWASDESKSMPPGLYIELGYWLTKVGRHAEAREAFDHELANYPYAEKYITALTALVLATTGTADEAEADPEAQEPTAEPAASEVEVQP